MANDQVRSFTDQNFEAEVKMHPELVLVDFWASWCGPCLAIAPHIEALASEYQGRVKIGKLNVDEEEVTARNLEIRALPTIMLFRDGEVVEQWVGAASKAKLNELIQKHL
jgi:thioredoxin 1